jgi:hypothetical protein
MSELQISASTLIPTHALKLLPVEGQDSVKQIGKAIGQSLKQVAHLEGIDGIQPVPQFYRELGSQSNDQAVTAHAGERVFFQFYKDMNMTTNVLKKQGLALQKVGAL